jgi:hypothetical protein
MPKLSDNEWNIRRASSNIATALDLPYDVVRSVIDALALHILDEIREQGIKDGDEAKKVKVELPNIGTLELFPAKYPDNETAILQGRAFKTKFTVKEAFLLKCRFAYYDQYNYLLEEATKGFKDLVKEHYTSIIRSDGDK